MANALVPVNGVVHNGALVLAPIVNENAERAKVVADVVIAGGCILAEAKAQEKAAEHCECISTRFRNAAISILTMNGANATRELAHKAIDSERCYGNADSLISRATNWIRLTLNPRRN